MNILFVDSVVFIRIPSNLDMERLKKALEVWRLLIGLISPALKENIQEHLEINYEARTILHDGNFIGLDANERRGIVNSLKTLIS